MIFNFYIIFLTFITVVHAQMLNETSPVIEVLGTGEVNVRSDIIDISVGVITKSLKANEAQNNTFAIANKILSGLISLNVSNLRTGSISLYPNYNYTAGASELIGFESFQTILFSSSPENAGKCIDNAIASGANNVDYVTPSVTKVVRDTSYLQSLENAAQDATRKAETISKALNIPLSGVISVVVDQISQPQPPMPFTAIESRMDSNMNTAIIPGEISVRSSVKVVYKSSKQFGNP